MERNLLSDKLKRILPVLCGAAVILCVASGAYYIFSSAGPIKGVRQVEGVVTGGALGAAVDVRAEASALVKGCATSEYHPTCYDDAIPKLMDKLTMEQAFDVTRAVQDMDPLYSYCHVLGHKLASIETAKDPTKWKDVVVRSPQGLCSNGSIHGAFQERFRQETISEADLPAFKKEVDDVCENRSAWHPTPIQQASCYHALGHLLMYVTGGEIHKSVALCQELAIKEGGRRDYQQLCYDGAFMQVFQPLEPDDFALIKGKVPAVADMAEYCKDFLGKQRQPCWSESWPLIRDTVLTSAGLTQFCTNKNLLTSEDKDRCFVGMFYVAMAQFQLNSTKMAELCGGLAIDRQPVCYANGASRLIETDFRNVQKAISLCKSGPTEPIRSGCYSELVKYSTYDFPSGSPEQAELCQSLPGEWKQQCVDRVRQSQ